MHVELCAGFEVVDEVPDEFGERRPEFESHPAELLDVDTAILEHDGPADFLVVRPAQGQQDLVAVAGHESLERVSADDEADGRLHGIEQLFGRRPRVIIPGQCDRRSSSVLLGQLAVGVTGQTVENVKPAGKRRSLGSSIDNPKQLSRFLVHNRSKLITKMAKLD